MHPKGGFSCFMKNRYIEKIFKEDSADNVKIITVNSTANKTSGGEVLLQILGIADFNLGKLKHSVTMKY